MSTCCHFPPYVQFWFFRGVRFKQIFLRIENFFRLTKIWLPNSNKMAVTWRTYNMNNLREATQILHEIKRRWLEIEQIPDLFRYKLNIRKERTLEGMCGYVVQLNLDRGTKRRKPIVIDSMRPQIDSNAFNFTKIQSEEILLELLYKDFTVSVLINHSPFTKYSCLLIPRLKDVLPQVLTLESIEFAMRLLRLFNSQSFMIGYNSPGAAASVNHLHLHLAYHVSELFAQTAELHKHRTGIYSLHPKYEVQAICFVMNDLSYDDHIIDASERVYKLVHFMIEENIPHNLFFTLAKQHSHMAMRIFVYPRSKACLIKDTTELNIAFAELSGFIPIANEKIFATLTERKVIDRIKSEQCDIITKLLAKVNDTKFYPSKH